MADRWATVEPSDHHGVSPFEGAEDLNSEAATALDGVLFMEGEGRPAEITAMIGELRAEAGTFTDAGEWLANAMPASWQMAAAMLEFDELADVMGERHRIISNDWLAAHMQSLIGTLLSRAADMLERVDLTPAALRADLAGARVAPRRLYAAAEVLSRAADLCCESAELVHDNERRWRVSRERTEELVQAMSPHGPAGTGRHGPLTRVRAATRNSGGPGLRAPVPPTAGRPDPACRPEGHERMGADELPQRGVVTQIAPAEDGAGEPHPVWVLPAEPDADTERLLLGKEPLLRGERPPAQLHLDCGVLLQVAIPVALRAPAGADHRLAAGRVVAQHHRDRLVRCPVLRPTWVNARNVRPTAGPALCW